MQGLTPKQQVKFELIQDALKQGVPPEAILVGIPKLIDLIFDENKKAEQPVITENMSPNAVKRAKKGSFNQDNKACLD